MSPGLSQCELSALVSGARAKMLAELPDEPFREKVQTGGRPSPVSLSSEAVPPEHSQGELSTSLSGTQTQVPPLPPDVPDM